MPMSKQDRSTAVAKAVAHPVRRDILRTMAKNSNGPVSPAKLAEELGVPIGTVAYHVRELKDHTVIKLVKTTPRRGAVEHFYTRTNNGVDQQVQKFLKMLKD